MDTRSLRGLSRLFPESRQPGVLDATAFTGSEGRAFAALGFPVAYNEWDTQHNELLCIVNRALVGTHDGILQYSLYDFEGMLAAARQSLPDCDSLTVLLDLPWGGYNNGARTNLALPHPDATVPRIGLGDILATAFAFGVDGCVCKVPSGFEFATLATERLPNGLYFKVCNQTKPGRRAKPYYYLYLTQRELVAGDAARVLERVQPANIMEAGVLADLVKREAESRVWVQDVSVDF